jgi:hypothetical protein
MTSDKAVKLRALYRNESHEMGGGGGLRSSDYNSAIICNTAKIIANTIPVVLLVK